MARKNKSKTIEAIQKTPLYVALRPFQVASIVFDPNGEPRLYASLSSSLRKKMERAGIPPDTFIGGQPAWYGTTWQRTIPEEYRKFTEEHQPPEAEAAETEPEQVETPAEQASREAGEEQLLVGELLAFLKKNPVLPFTLTEEGWKLNDDLETPLWHDKIPWLPADMPHQLGVEPGVQGLFQLIWHMGEQPRRMRPNITEMELSAGDWLFLMALNRVMWWEYYDVPALMKTLLRLPETTQRRAALARLIMACCQFQQDYGLYFQHKDRDLVGRRVAEAEAALAAVAQICEPWALLRCEAELFRIQVLHDMMGEPDRRTALSKRLATIDTRKILGNPDDSPAFCYYLLLAFEALDFRKCAPYEGENVFSVLTMWEQEKDLRFYYHGAAMRLAGRRRNGTWLHDMMHDSNYTDMSIREPYSSYYRFSTALALEGLGAPVESDWVDFYSQMDFMYYLPFERIMLELTEQAYWPDMPSIDRDL